LRYSLAAPTAPRRGAVLVLFAVCLIAIMGLLALVIDGGLLRAEQLRVQAAADAAALAGATRLYATYPRQAGLDGDGSAAGAARAMAVDNGCDGAGATVAVNIPPSAGQYAGRPGYIEVLIASRQDRIFSNIWSADPLYVRARAVARGSWAPFSATLLLLDEGDRGAVSVKGNGAFTGSGAMAYINSNSSAALSVSGGGTFQGAALDIVGSYSGNGITGTITTGVRPMPDPLAYLPAPGENGAPPVPAAGSMLKTPLGNNYQYDLYPGSHDNLPSFGSGDKVIFHQASSGAGGIFYLASGGLHCQGAEVVMASGETGGLMIYNAGTDSGSTISITGNASSSVSLSHLTDGIYTGLVLFQARTSTLDVSLTGNGSFNILGTIYAPAARIHVTGNGSASGIGSQWIARELFLAGNGSITVPYTDATVARTRVIALME
jgi:hypothetical protein